MKRKFQAVCAAALLLGSAGASAADDKTNGGRLDTLGFDLYDPMYFIVGGDGGLNAKFQVSFKYQFFSGEGWMGKHVPFAQDFYLSYSQTSLWDLDELSSPFKDSSYKPRIFYALDNLLSDDSAWSLGIEAGFAHESNGKAGVD
jgi:phospholipase A1/A2